MAVGVESTIPHPALKAASAWETHDLKKIAASFLAILLAALGLFFLWVIAYLGSSEVMPALRQGSLNVETSTMILNRTWDGNEIYLILFAYLLLAVALVYGAYKVLRKTFAGCARPVRQRDRGTPCA